MFSITSSKGFQMTFENGVTVSVQFGPGNYCENRDKDFNAPNKADRWNSKDAEVAIILPNGDFYSGQDFHGVEGWQSVKDVVGWINFAMNMKVV